jgi:hypothetical protein
MRSEEIAIYIGGIVGEFPIEVSQLLRKNSIVNSQYVPSSISELVENTFVGLQNSQNFKSDFSNLMINKGKNDSTLNKSFFLNTDGITSSSGSNTMGYVNAGVNLIGSAFNFFGKDKDIKSAQATANAQIESNKLALEAKRLELEGKKLDADTALALAKGSGGAKKSNTGLYIGLGVGGVVILGLVVYLAVKK